MVEKFDNKDHDRDRFFIESENIAKAIGPWIYEAMRERNRYFTLQEVTPSKDKMKRSSVLQAMVRAGAVKFNTESGWWLDAKSQILQFPMGAYKDDVDALSHIAAGIRLFAAPATDQEVADEEYEMEFFWNDVSSEQGRNRVTGY